MYRSIAVTTDFSEPSMEPFEAAALTAKKFGAKLWLVNVSQNPAVVTPWQISSSPAELEARRQAAQRRLEDLARGTPAFAGMKIEARAVLGDSAEAVCDFQEREQVDLLIIATHSHGKIKNFLLGSFTAKVLQLAACPLLVFRTFEGEAPKRTFNPSRILVPCDFSRYSKSSLETAREWAKAFDAMVNVLHVVEQRINPDTDLLAPSRTVEEYYERRVAEASNKLKGLVESTLNGVPVQTAVCIGNPAAKIIEKAEDLGARLIVMPSRGITVLDRIAMGSVAERTIHGAKCPVLVTRRMGA